MKSSAKIGFGVGVSLTVGFLLFVFIGMTLDGTLPTYSKWWFGFVLILILLTLLFIISYLKIPKFEIIGNRIYYKALGKKAVFDKSEIIELKPVDAKINGWYSFRGGVEIITKQDRYEFPFHFYANEAELLQKLYGIQPSKVKLVKKYALRHLGYMKYFYKNPHVISFLMMIAFVWLIWAKTNALYGKVIFGILAFIVILPFLLSCNYVKLSENNLTLFQPFLLKSTTIKIGDIEHVNTRPIFAGKGGSIKQLTFTLNDKTIKMIKAGLNKQSELDEIANELNATL